MAPMVTFKVSVSDPVAIEKLVWSNPLIKFETCYPIPVLINPFSEGEILSKLLMVW